MEALVCMQYLSTLEVVLNYANTVYIPIHTSVKKYVNLLLFLLAIN